MGSLLHPVGPQPVWVYWARRGAVLLGVLLVVAALAFVFRPEPPPTVAAQPADPVASGPTGAASATASASSTPTPTGPLVCDSSNSKLALAGYQKVAQDGKQSFKVTVTNTGTAPCALSVKPATFSLVVASGSDRIWTTEHCAKWVPSATVTLKPGKVREFSIGWPVARSAAGCKTTKATLGKGTYVATAELADAEARQVFLVTDKN